MEERGDGNWIEGCRKGGETYVCLCRMTASHVLGKTRMDRYDM